MSSAPFPCIDREALRQTITAASGALRVGFACAAAVDADARDIYLRWIADGRHGEMSYLERYQDVRDDPRLLLDGAATVISCAFDYRQPHRHPLFADYALGRDYHEVVRERLTDAAEAITATYGGQTRVCVDTAPIRERYWAARAGIGRIGLNNQLIVDGVGSQVFLGEIIWTVDVEPDHAAEGHGCGDCRACVRACPAGALDGCGSIDARRCLSYLTIEYRGELPRPLPRGGRIYGCDICQAVCPRCVPAADSNPIADLAARPSVMSLDREAIAAMTQEDFSRIFTHSAVKRCKLAGLKRNLQAGE